MRATEDQCTCGHVEAAHTHFRRGSDCGICGARACTGFRLATMSNVIPLAPRAALRAGETPLAPAVNDIPWARTAVRRRPSRSLRRARTR